MNFSCFSCNTVTQLDLKFEPNFFSCPNCHSLYEKNQEGQFFYKHKFTNEKYTNAFYLGQKALINNLEYVVVGIVIKKQAGERWAEYVLQDQGGLFLYLSEFNGNFILLEAVEFDKKVGNHPLTVAYNDKVLDRYAYYYPDLVYAEGFFDFNIQSKIELIEFIKPPYILSVERFENKQRAFFGEHLSRQKVKEAFRTQHIPSKSENGIVQPFLINISNLVITFSIVSILMLLSHWFLNRDRVETEVLNTSLPFENYNNKEFISPSFELKGSSAPLEISLYSPVDNSWANVQVALVNEVTSEEVYASKDVEYYYGYTDGENWNEGSTREDFNICGVKAGKYHLVITPSKAPEDTTNTTVDVIATWNKPSLRNVFMVVLFMAIFTIIVYYFWRKFEEKRWAE